MHTQNILQAATTPHAGAVRIGFNHGYAFDGDSVRLDAELLVGHPDVAAGQEWALQLWACETPFAGESVKGTKVAELPVGQIDSLNQSWVSAFTGALPPAGHAEHSMVLVLASGRDGQFDEVQDFANFPRPERFAQPRLAGASGFSLGEQSVGLRIESLENPRSADNLSGTLSLELWALATPYLAGTPDGVQLAAAQLGTLAGQHSWHDLDLTLPLAARPVGTWHVAMLLREWTAAGYATRDFANFSLPVSWAADAKPDFAPQAADTEPAAQPKAAGKAAPTKAAAKAAAKSAAKAAPTDTAGRVSINTASKTELAALKGLSKTAAAAIIAARPFKSIDELLTVRGIGAKLLDKLKGTLSL